MILQQSCDIFKMIPSIGKFFDYSDFAFNIHTFLFPPKIDSYPLKSQHDNFTILSESFISFCWVICMNFQIDPVGTEFVIQNADFT